MKRSYPSPTKGDIVVEGLASTQPGPLASRPRDEATKRRRIDPLGPDPCELPGPGGHRGGRHGNLQIPREQEYHRKPADLSIESIRRPSRQNASINSRRDSSKRSLLASPFHISSEARAPKPSLRPNGALSRRLSARFETSGRRASAGRLTGSRASLTKASAKRRQSGSHKLNHPKTLDSSTTFPAQFDHADWTVTSDDYADPLPFPKARNLNIQDLPPRILPYEFSSQRLSENELLDRHAEDLCPRTPPKKRRELPKTPIRSPTMSWEISPSDTLFRTVTRSTNFRKSPCTASRSSILGSPSQNAAQAREGLSPELPQMFSIMCGIEEDDLLTDPLTHMNRSNPPTA
ncbi:hypothetical protein M407DRAFT_30330 [Tulasnella calospora MUT 4182]|uniref:Uncharacterized protein n=1 Tax=Tulasnella calospora MUT 4182 TaxID=1051891 RepID=A0A0C3LF06_9AGAM|nr:hypothetical protein M407DRAFT_30330 [Tulasnella calospora MUT 4182]